MSSREDMAQGLADRVRNLLRALDRQDRLETAQTFVGWLGRQITEGQLAESSEEVLLRTLRVAGDPVNFRLLTQLDPLEASEVPALMEQLGLGRVAVSERVNDLVQAGLASRDMVSDQIRGTALAAGIVTWVRDLADESATRVGDQLRAETADQDG